MKTYLTIFFGSALVTQLATPWVARLARRLNAIDKPDPRKVHRMPIPRLGGVAIVAGVLALITPVLLLNNDIGAAFRAVQTQILVLLGASLVVFFLGALDDTRGLSAKLKLLGLIGAALAVYAAGGRIDQIEVEGLFVLHLGWASLPLTLLWIVGVTVSMNFIDGLDGLAAGIALLTSAVIGLFAFFTGQIVMGCLMLALVGSLTGFLFLNFNPARVFMGDCGSMFLGFIIAASSVVCTVKTCTLIGLALPAAVLGVPILDTVFTVIRRGILERRSVFAAERGHIHHRLLDRGLAHRHAVFVIYGMTLLGATAGVTMLMVREATAIYVLSGVFVALLLMFHLFGSSRIGETLAAIRRNRAIAQMARQEQCHFEDMQLRVRAAQTFEDWWQALAGLAEQMGFDHLALAHSAGPADRHLWTWSRPGIDLRPEKLIRVSVPLRDSADLGRTSLDVCVHVNGSLETTGRRMTLFGRLLDEYGFDKAFRLTGASAEAAEAEEIAMPAKTTPDSSSLPEPIDVLGVDVTPFASYAHAVQCAEQAIRTQRQNWWVAINPQKVHRAGKEPAVREALHKADAGICDGIGVSLAAKLIHGQAVHRCTGCDLFSELVAAAAQRGWRIYLLGASHEANEGAVHRLRERYPTLQIVGHRDGFFKPEEEPAVVADINESGADLLFVAMGSPKQEFWLARHRHELRPAFLLGVGGTFDVVSGLARRAPAVFRKTGTEFLFQLINQPWRWKRQMAYFPYMANVLRESLFGSRYNGSSGPDREEKAGGQEKGSRDGVVQA